MTCKVFLSFAIFRIVLCEALDFSRLRKNFEDLSPYSCQLHLLLILMLLIFCWYILSSQFLQSIYSEFSMWFVLLCSSLSLFSKNFFPFFVFWACSFEDSIENVLISHLRNSHLTWGSIIFSISKVSGALLMWNFILIRKSEFMLKELLSFESPLPLFSSLQKSRKNSKVSDQ